MTHPLSLAEIVARLKDLTSTPPATPPAEASAVSDRSEEAIMQVLNTLDSLPSSMITVDELKSTQAGIIVNTLRKHKSNAIAEFGKRLVNKWKDILQENAKATAPPLLPAVSSPLPALHTSALTASPDRKRKLSPPRPVDDIERSPRSSPRSLAPLVPSSCSSISPENYNPNAAHRLLYTDDSELNGDGHTDTDMTSRKRTKTSAVDISAEPNARPPPVNVPVRLCSLLDLCLDAMSQPNVAAALHLTQHHPPQHIQTIYHNATPTQLAAVSKRSPHLAADLEPLWRNHVARIYHMTQLPVASTASNSHKPSTISTSWYALWNECESRRLADEAQSAAAREQRLSAVSAKLKQRLADDRLSKAGSSIQRLDNKAATKQFLRVGRGGGAAMKAAVETNGTGEKVPPKVAAAKSKVSLLRAESSCASKVFWKGTTI